MGWKEKAKTMNDNPENYVKKTDDVPPVWHNWVNEIQAKGTKPKSFLFTVKGSYIVQNGRAMGQHALYGDVEYTDAKDGNNGVEHMLVPQKARSLLLGKDSTDLDLPTLVGKAIIFKDYGKTQNEWVDKLTGKPRKSREFRNVIAEEWKE